MDVDVAAGRWLAGLAGNTRKCYERDWRQFRGWLRAGGEEDALGAPSRDVLLRWQRYLHEEEGLKNNSVNRKMSALRSWQMWLHEEGWLIPLPARIKCLPSPPMSHTRWLTSQEIAALFSTAATMSHERRALVWLLAHGLRSEEARLARWVDVHRQAGFWMLRVDGKGSRVRDIRLAAASVQVFRRAATSNPDGYILWSPVAKGRRGGPWIKKTVAAIGEAAGVGHVHPHMLRHSYAVSLLEAGANQRQIQRALGHASPQITEQYLHGLHDWRTIPIEQLASLWQQGIPTVLPEVRGPKKRVRTLAHVVR